MDHTVKILDQTREQIFDKLSCRWEKIIEKDYSFSLEELMKSADVEDRVVVDISLGTGVLVESGFEAKAAKWIEVDISGKRLRVSKDKHFQKIEEGFLEIIHADVHRLPLETNTADRVFCHNVYHHFCDPEVALKEIYRILKPGGVLIISHYSGREFINHIHSQFSNPTLSKDMLDPAYTLSYKLFETGFFIREIIDEREKYRIIAYKEK